MSPSLQFLLTALAALLGAWAGAYVALSRFKKERAFDLRADWYARGFRSLMSLSVALGELEQAFRDDSDEAEEVGQRLGELMDRAGPDFRDVVLYGRPDAVKAVGRVGRAMGALNDGGRQDLTTEEVLSEVRAARQVVFDAAMDIAEEGRIHLDLEAAPEVVALAIRTSPSRSGP